MFDAVLVLCIVLTLVVTGTIAIRYDFLSRVSGLAAAVIIFFIIAGSITAREPHSALHFLYLFSQKDL